MIDGISITPVDIDVSQDAQDETRDSFYPVDVDTGVPVGGTKEDRDSVAQSEIERCIELASNHILHAVSMVDGSRSAVEFTIRNRTNFDRGALNARNLVSLVVAAMSRNSNTKYRSEHEMNQVLGEFFYAILESVDYMPDALSQLLLYRPFYDNTHNSRLTLIACIMRLIGLKDFEKYNSPEYDLIGTLKSIEPLRSMPNRYLRLSSDMYRFFPMTERVMFSLIEMCERRWQMNISNAAIDEVACRAIGCAIDEVTSEMVAEVRRIIESLRDSGRIGNLTFNRRYGAMYENVSCNLVMPVDHKDTKFVIYDSSTSDAITEELTRISDNIEYLSDGMFDRRVDDESNRQKKLRTTMLAKRITNDIMQLKAACVESEEPFGDALGRAISAATDDFEVVGRQVSDGPRVIDTGISVTSNSAPEVDSFIDGVRVASDTFNSAVMMARENFGGTSRTYNQLGDDVIVTVVTKDGYGSGRLSTDNLCAMMLPYVGRQSYRYGYSKPRYILRFSSEKDAAIAVGDVIESIMNSIEDRPWWWEKYVEMNKLMFHDREKNAEMTIVAAAMYSTCKGRSRRWKDFNIPEYDYLNMEHELDKRDVG